VTSALGKMCGDQSHCLLPVLTPDHLPFPTYQLILQKKQEIEVVEVSSMV
jgi:hypothetical protein